METLLAILAALPKLIALFNLIGGMVQDAEQRGLGRKEAVADALAAAHRDIALADAETVQAMQSHAKIKDDSAFDQDFKEG